MNGDGDGRRPEERPDIRSALHHHLRHVDPGGALFQPVLDDPAGYIAGGGNDTQIYLGAFLDFLLILANVGTAVVLYPIARRQNELLAIGFVGARIIESVFIAGGIIFVLGVVSLRQDGGPPGRPEFVWELSLGVYAAGWGFRRDAPILRRAHASLSPA